MPGPYTWDAGALRYRDRDGRYVPRADLRDAVDAYAEATAEDARRLAARLVAGSIDVAAWRGGMEQLIRDSAVAGTAIGAGGRSRATPADLGRAGAEVREQLRHLRDFTAGVESGDVPRDGRLAARAALYAGAAVRSFDSAQRARLAGPGGYRQERRRLDPSAAHCAPCKEYAARGWVPAGTLPGIGKECDCHGSCRCKYEYRDRIRGEG